MNDEPISFSLQAVPDTPYVKSLKIQVICDPSIPLTSRDTVIEEAVLDWLAHSFVRRVRVMYKRSE